MKPIVYSPAALVSFDSILDYTLENFGTDQATHYTGQFVARLEALASGDGPQARPCALLMQGISDVTGLSYYREGSHFLILRERADVLEVVEILHGQMNLDVHLERLSNISD